jgi:peroxiredoxin
MIKRIIIALAIAALLAIPGCSDKPDLTAAPTFTLNSLAGQPVSLADFRGRPLVINFWQISCPPCIEELPLFQSVSVSEKQTAIVAIALRDSQTALKSFMAENGYTFTVLLDPVTAAAAAYDVRFTPTTFFIDSQGRVTEVKVGPFTSKSELEQAIRRLS